MPTWNWVVRLKVISLHPNLRRERQFIEICHASSSSPEIVFVQFFSRDVETRFL